MLIHNLQKMKMIHWNFITWNGKQNLSTSDGRENIFSNCRQM